MPPLFLFLFYSCSLVCSVIYIYACRICDVVYVLVKMIKTQKQIKLKKSLGWSELTWNDLTMERNEAYPTGIRGGGGYSL